VAIGPLKTAASTFVGMFKTNYHNVSATLYTPDDFQTVDAVTISSTVIHRAKGDAHLHPHIRRRREGDPMNASALLLVLAGAVAATGCANHASAGPPLDPGAAAELTKAGAPPYPGAELEGDGALNDHLTSGKRHISVDLITSDDFASVNAWYKAHVGPRLVYSDQGTPDAPMAVYQFDPASLSDRDVITGKVIVDKASGGASGTEIILYSNQLK